MSDTRTKAILNETAHQRNGAADIAAAYAGEIAVLRETVAELQKLWESADSVRARWLELTKKPDE